MKQERVFWLISMATKGLDHLSELSSFPDVLEAASLSPYSQLSQGENLALLVSSVSKELIVS